MDFGGPEARKFSRSTGREFGDSKYSSNRLCIWDEDTDRFIAFLKEKKVRSAVVSKLQATRWSDIDTETCQAVLKILRQRERYITSTTEWVPGKGEQEKESVKGITVGSLFQHEGTTYVITKRTNEELLGRGAEEGETK